MEPEVASWTFIQFTGLSKVSLTNVWLQWTNGPLFIVLHETAVAWIGFLPNWLMQLWRNRKLSQ